MVTSIKGNDTSTFGGNVDVTGNVVTDAPAFRASNSSDQSISSSTNTKVILDTEIYDTNNCFDTSNSRFTPNVAGYYLINVTIRFEGTNNTNNTPYIAKNGEIVSLLGANRTTSSSPQTFSGSDIIYCNGTTDYIEAYGYVAGTSLYFGYGATNNNCFMSGSLVRAV